MGVVKRTKFIFLRYLNTPQITPMQYGFMCEFDIWQKLSVIDILYKECIPKSGLCLINLRFRCYSHSGLIYIYKDYMISSLNALKVSLRQMLEGI